MSFWFVNCLFNLCVNCGSWGRYKDSLYLNGVCIGMWLDGNDILEIFKVNNE